MQKYLELCSKHLIQPDVQCFNQLKACVLSCTSSILSLHKANPAQIPGIITFVNLTKLHIFETDISQYFDQFYQNLTNSPSILKELILNDCNLNFNQTQKVLIYASKQKQLETVELQKCQIDFALIKQHQTKLSSLDIKNSVIKNGQDIAEFVLHQKCLKNLDLSFNDLSNIKNVLNIFVNYFTHYPISLNMSYCNLNRQEVKQLIYYSNNCQTLTSLFLNGQATDLEEKEINKKLLKNMLNRQVVDQTTSLSQIQSQDDQQSHTITTTQLNQQTKSVTFATLK